MLKKIINKKFIPVLLTVLLFLLFYIISINFSQEDIRAFIEKFGVFGPIIFIILYLLTHIFAPLSGTPFIFVGFLLFGQLSIIYVTIATMFSSIINFWIARKWGRPLIEKFVGKENLTKIDKFVQNYGLGFLFIIRIFQGGADDYISYAAGLTNLKLIPYFVISTLGMIPGTILWYYLSKYVNTPLEFTILTVGMVFIFSGIFIIGTIIAKKLKS